MNHLLKNPLLIVICLFVINLTSCQSLDDIYDRLDKVEADIDYLKAAQKALQEAYDQGKIIKSVTPLTTTNTGGWLVVFSDGSNIQLYNGENGKDGVNGQDGKDGKDGVNGQDGKDGKDGVNGQDGKDGKDGVNGQDGKNGVTPYVKIDHEGYWTISYDNGVSFVRLLDAEGSPIKAIGSDGKDGVNGQDGKDGKDGKDGVNGQDGKDGKDGLSVRIVVNEYGFYVLQTYNISSPEVVIDETVTPYTSNPSNIIKSINQDDKTQVITIVLADGSSFTFNKQYVTPTSIAILSTNAIYLGKGAQASVEFRINPSDAQIKFDGEDAQIILDRVGEVETRSSYVTIPTNYKLVKIEQVYDANTNELKEGQYRAIIEDNGITGNYDELASLVLNIESENGRAFQISSSAFEIKAAWFSELNTGMPLLFINTPNSAPIVSKDEYIEGATISLLNSNMSFDFQGEMKIKGRGNSTWNAPKKPYKIKFDKKQSLLGEPKDKEWVLLANYHDKPMLRTDLAFWMAKKYGNFDYVPSFHYVDLILNGKYNGTYQLGDQLKISENRVNVGSDGFLLEIDAKAAPEDITFMVPHISKSINIKDPDVVEGDENYNYIVDYVTRADEALYAKDWLDEERGYKTLIDMQSFVEWYIMMELTKNNDAIFWTSCYMNLSRGGKLKMGPLWDFDVSMGGYPFQATNNINSPEGFHIRKASWINRMFQDPAFVSTLKERFEVYYQNRKAILSHINSIASQNRKSAIANNKLWGTLCNKNSTDTEIIDAYDEQVEYLKNWLTNRLEWLKVQFDDM